MKRNIILAILLLTFTECILAQVFNNPQAGMKSHPTLNIIQVEAEQESTVIYFTIENRIAGGTFCIDNNTWIVYPDGSRIKVSRFSGIPVCPDTYKFSMIGEKISFTLTFPALKPGTEWIDIVEECDQNCVWFYGITLNNDLNDRLNQIFIAAGNNTPEENIRSFSDLLESVDKENQGIEGLLYINIINAAMEAGDKDEAAAWYKRLASSLVPHLQHYIRYLNETGIKF